jgi:tetratricopeptide (TPR) repeat protein
VNDTPCRASESFLKAMELGEASGNAENYARLADQIEEYKEKYRRVKAERPEGSQVFICFKDTGTQDGKLGYRIFNTFARKYDVFFSKESLLDIGGNDYEPYIYHALTTAKVLLVLCSDRDHLESKWVHNEWWRFWRFARGTDRVIIPIFREGFDANQLPDELRSCQGIPEDVGLLSTLTARLEAVFGEKTVPPAPARAVEETAEQKVDSYLERINTYLSAYEFEAAKDYAAEAIRLDPLRGEAYLVAMLADLRLVDLNALLRLERPFDGNRYYEKAVRYLPSETANALKKRNEILRERQTEKNGKIAKRIGLGLAILVGLVIAIVGISSSVRESKIDRGISYLNQGEVDKAYECLYEVRDEDRAKYYLDIATAYRQGRYGSYIKYRGLGEFAVPEGTVSINEETLGGNTQLTKVILPDSLQIIGDRTFLNFDQLTEVNLPQRVTEIGVSAFANCSRLTSITIRGNVTKIGGGAFAGCMSLTEVTIPASVTTVGTAAFSGCLDLERVTIKEGVTRIEGDAFSNCPKLTSLTVPEGVTVFGSLSGCDSLKTLVLPKSLTSAWHVVTELSGVDVFFAGEREDVIPIFGENSFGDNNLYFYSSIEEEGCWHYVDGVPTPW